MYAAARHEYLAGGPRLSHVADAANPLKLDGPRPPRVVALADLYRRLRDDLYHVFIQQRTPILHRKYDVVVNLPRTMTRLITPTPKYDRI